MRRGLAICATFAGCTPVTAPHPSPDASPIPEALAQIDAKVSVPSAVALPPTASPPHPGYTPPSSPDRTHLDVQSDGRRGARAHVMEVKRDCWLGIDGGGGSFNVHVVIDAAGRVASASSRGSNRATGACLEKEIRAWVFPSSSGSTPVDLPFKV